MAQYVANPMKLVNVSITSSCEITYYFSNDEFYRIFDIAVNVGSLNAPQAENLVAEYVASIMKFVNRSLLN